MLDKFSIDELMIKVMPWGFFLWILLFLFWDIISFELDEKLDFFYTFVFFCVAFITWEILQTIAHEIEGIVDIFFKFLRPSEIFLYKWNPIISDKKRWVIIEKLNIPPNELQEIDKSYKDIPFLKKRKQFQSWISLSQHYFWQLYSQVRGSDEIKTVNRGYLFVRVMMTAFFLLSVIAILACHSTLSILLGLLSLIFLWRSRGCAKSLVFNTVLTSFND